MKKTTPKHTHYSQNHLPELSPEVIWDALAELKDTLGELRDALRELRDGQLLYYSEILGGPGASPIEHRNSYLFL